MNMTKRFIEWNKRLSMKFREAFPSVCKVDESRGLFAQVVEREVAARKAAGSGLVVLEIGGIDRPFLSKAECDDYCGLDVEKRERCDEVYDRFYQQSVEEPIPGSFDLVISRMVLEHVPDNEKGWANIYECLKPGGRTLHIFPSGLHPYSILTRLVGNRLQRKLISLFRPHAAAKTGYPAYYNRCLPGQLRTTLGRAGFKDPEIHVFYCAASYFSFFAPAFVAVSLFEHLCRKAGIERFCSNVFVCSGKEAAESGGGEDREKE